MDVALLESLEINRGYIEMLRGHVREDYLQKCGVILDGVESHLHELVTTPVPRSADYLRASIACVLRNISETEGRIAKAEVDTVSDSLRRSIAEVCLGALRFQLDLLTCALSVAIEADETQWIN